MGTQNYFFWDAFGWCNGYAGLDPKYFSLASYQLDALGVRTYNQAHTEMIAIPVVGSHSVLTVELLRRKSADYYEQGLTREVCPRSPADT